MWWQLAYRDMVLAKGQRKKGLQSLNMPRLFFIDEILCPVLNYYYYFGRNQVGNKLMLALGYNEYGTLLI
jgi:hypothetical protein